MKNTFKLFGFYLWIKEWECFFDRFSARKQKFCHSDFIGTGFVQFEDILFFFDLGESRENLGFI